MFIFKQMGLFILCISYICIKLCIFYDMLRCHYITKYFQGVTTFKITEFLKNIVGERLVGFLLPMHVIDSC